MYKRNAYVLKAHKRCDDVNGSGDKLFTSKCRVDRTLVFDFRVRRKHRQHYLSRLKQIVTAGPRFLCMVIKYVALLDIDNRFGIKDLLLLFLTCKDKKKWDQDQTDA